MQFGTLADFVLVEDGLYKGDLRRGGGGIPHGSGTLIYFTDDSKGRYNYSGDWRDGSRHGLGATAFRNGDLYRGRYSDGLENGRGKIFYSNGDTFEGAFYISIATKLMRHPVLKI